MPQINFELKLGDQTMNASVKVPAEPVRPVDLLPILQGFCNAVVGVAASEHEPISCRAGCGACCRQMVPISETEALYLARLIESFPDASKEVLKARFQDVVAKMREAGLDNEFLAEAISRKESRRKMGDLYFQLGLPCPFLENESCSIHEHRPLSCREYLVTSPAENCKTPSAEGISMVPMYANMSHVLYCFGDAKGNAPASVIPLPLLLEYADEHHIVDQPLLPGPVLFENFFRKAMEPGA